MLWTCEGERKGGHGYGTNIALYDVFTEIEDYMEMSKCITAENDIIVADGYEYSSMKLV